MTYGCVIGGIIGLILGAVAGYVQTENERNETHMFPANYEVNGFATNPNVISIEVISNNEH